MTVNLPRTAIRWARFIKHWDDETRFGDGYSVTLAHGYAFSDNSMDNANHVRNFATVKAAIEAIRADALPCRCNRCEGMH